MPRIDRMRRFWNDAARDNAVWYVDTSVDFDHPDMQVFFDHGRQVAEQALKHFEPDPARHVALEIGSGLGRIIGALAPRFRTAVGVDISEEMLRRAKDTVQMPNGGWVVNSGQDLGCIADASVDLVVTFTVFQHFPSVRSVLGYISEVERILKPGGHGALQMSTIEGSRSWAVRRSALAALQKVGLKRHPRRTDEPYFLGSRVPLPKLRAHLASIGLREIEIEGTGTLFTMAHVEKLAA